MATPPEPGKPDPRRQPSGGQLPPGSKPKMPAGNQPAPPGSSGSRQPVPKPGSGKGPMQTPPGASGRNRSVVGASVSADRHTLGLSDVRPSEAIKGLDRVADKYEKPKGPKRKAGEIDMNVAVSIDQKGKRWSRMVLLGVLGAIAVTGLFVWVLVILGGDPPIDPKVAYRETHNQLLRIKRYAYDMDRFGTDENVSPDLFKRKLKEYMKARQDKLEEVVEMETKAGGLAKPDTRDELKNLKADQDLKDAWEKELLFETGSEDMIVVRSLSGNDLKKEIPIPREQARAGP
jgi:hypothetical protein